MRWHLRAGLIVLTVLLVISCPSYERVIRLPKVDREYVELALYNLRSLRQKLTAADTPEQFKVAFDENAIKFSELAADIRRRYYGKVQHDPTILFAKMLNDYPGKVSQFKLEFRLIVSEIQRITPHLAKASNAEQIRVQNSIKSWFQTLDQINRP